ncbi:MAG: hypothetical protein M1825_000446 [Sarcosagium campestre]|nr:MAG: hypothetical protein M1825_000446 [Sarcosagium campestre]
MSPLMLSKDGFFLEGAPDASIGDAKPKKRPTQAMGLEFPEGVIDDLLKAGRGSGKGIQLSFGKVLSINFGTHTRQINSSSERFRHEIYCSDEAASGEQSKIKFAGLATHKLEMSKAEEVTAGVDAAMLALQSKMIALEEAKKSKKTLFVEDSSKLPPAGPVKRGTPKPKAQVSASFLSGSRQKIFNNGTTRSIPPSPSLSARSSPIPPVSTPPTSAPVIDNPSHTRLQALRIPLIHLLAIGPIEEELLARKTRSTKDDCLEILQKIGKPSSASAWRLSDRGYKELDVWTFPYASQADRQSAIDNAVSAFDRLRLSREESLWQMLLPKAERGKGKILSKLHLHAGPMQRISTPKISIRQTESAGSTDSDRSTKRDSSDAGLSSSHSAAKKTKATKEAEAMSKRLLSKSPKQIAKPAARPKVGKPAQKTGVGKGGDKFKSSEYIVDSDEDISMEEADAVKPALHGARKGDSPVSETKAGAKSTENARSPTGAVNGKSKVAPETTAAPKAVQRKSEVTQPKVPSKTAKTTPKTESLPRGSSKVPSKPSPLGSSPPTNASDMDSEPTGVSSSSSSPLISQVRRPVQASAQRNGVHRSDQQDPNGRTPLLKRKAEDSEPQRIESQKRRQTSPLSSECYSSSSLSPPSNHQTVELARKFKETHARYERLYRELARTKEAPPQEKVKQVIDLHKRLEIMKGDIARSAGLN